MQRRQKEAAEAYERAWDGGAGSFHADYDPDAAVLEDFAKATRETEELYNAVVKNDVAKVSAGPRRSSRSSRSQKGRAQENWPCLNRGGLESTWGGLPAGLPLPPRIPTLKDPPPPTELLGHTPRPPH